MQIKEVAARALRFLGREDVAGKVATGEIPENDAELVRTLVFCINALLFPARAHADYDIL